MSALELGQKVYAKMLSVHLFTMMEEGEKLLHADSETFDLSPLWQQQACLAQKWLDSLSELDTCFIPERQKAVSSNAAQCSQIDRHLLEDYVNETAHILMCLEDRYGIFANHVYHKNLH